MADRGVARERLHVVDGALVRAADERPLHAAVLVAERDLQVQDVLAVTLEAEVAGLDDPGMHGADGDLVHLLAFDPEEIHDAGRNRCVVRVRPAVVTRPVGAVKADSFQPGVPQWPHAPLLGHLAFEPVRLRAVGRQRRIGISNHDRAHGERPLLPVRQNGDQANAVRLPRLSKECGDPAAVLDAAQDGVSEGRKREDGDFAQWSRLAVSDGQRWNRRHELTRARAPHPRGRCGRQAECRRRGEAPRPRARPRGRP